MKRSPLTVAAQVTSKLSRKLVEGGMPKRLADDHLALLFMAGAHHEREVSGDKVAKLTKRLDDASSALTENDVPGFFKEGDDFRAMTLEQRITHHFEAEGIWLEVEMDEEEGDGE